MTRQRQASLLALVTDDDRPLHLWVASMLTLVPRIYPLDAALAADFDAAIRDLGTIDFACIRTDHPSAPPPGAPARDALAYLFRDDDELQAQLNRLITRVDQIAGRQQVLAAARSTIA
ncbi:MAG TPA: hypothetical protein VN605_10795 [Thermoanaerobaculia bacterium]|nr:hypothetical protein [Thermoanaerobaculia bacterium]